MRPGALTDLLRRVAASPEEPEAEAPLHPGAVVGRFEILRELGRGGFGVVYEARDLELGRQVALKVVRPGRAEAEDGKVAREAEAIARLSHPNLVTLHDVGHAEHGPYLVFELLRGKTLQERLDDGPLPVQEAVHVAVEVARGLAHAHAEGVVHRDLKPSNVFVTNKGQVKILDFGMAHAFGRRRLSGGTPAYMAPEQWEDDPEDERTDVFALGVMLQQMLTGEYPFPEGEGRWSAGPAAAPKLDVPGAPGLAGLVDRMLEKAPKGRPRDGAAVLAALVPIEEALRSMPADGSAPVHATRRRATFGDLLAELKRRRVFRVMAGYGIFAFAVLQVTEPVMHGAELPDWVLKAVLMALAVGFPVAVVLAWVFDLTAQGVQRTPSANRAPLSGRARFTLLLAVAAGVLAISVAGAGGWLAWNRAGVQRREPEAEDAKPSIAVLSFADLSPGHDQESLADGVAEEVLNGLAQVDGLRVIGRSTSFSYKGKGRKVEEIGRELGVGSVLDGSVRRSGDKVRITAQLVRIRDASAVWSRSFERSLSDVFAVQDEIGRDVVEALAVRLLPGRSSGRAGGTTNPEALQLYLRGRDLLRRGASELPKALEAFEKAVAVDPLFALAWVGIADAIVTIEATVAEVSGEPAARRRRAHETADVAVGLAPGLADAFRARADVRQWLEADWRGQREDVERARALAPGDSAVALSGGFSLLVHGRTDEAVAEFERVTRIDPLLERGWVSGWLGLAAAAYSRGDHVKSRQAAGRMAELFPGYRAFAMVTIAMDRVVAGEAREALAMAGEFRAMGPPGLPWALLVEALAHQDLGRPADAVRAREELARDFGALGPYQVAQTYAWAGNADAAFTWLERARAFPDTAMFWLKTDPLLRKLRGDPRWAELLRRADLPPDGQVSGAAPPSPVAPSIAVLPFTDMSEKHDQGYFADGVAEEILNALAQVKGLKVIGRTSSFSFKGKADDLRVIGQKLGAKTLLEGSVRKEGSRLRVTAQLVQAADGAQVWSQKFDRDQAKVFAVQEEIARAVVAALQVTLLPGEDLQARWTRTDRPEVYNQLLLAGGFLQRGTVDDFRRALEAFEKAVALDPGYAPAWAGVANAAIAVLAWGREDPGLRAKALAAAEKAVALAPDLPNGYFTRARARRMLLFDWGAAAADLARARALGPNAPVARAAGGTSPTAAERSAAEIALQREATGRDPLNSDAWVLLGMAYEAAADLDGARAALRRALEISPGHGPATMHLCGCLVAGGQATEALALAATIGKDLDWLRLTCTALAQSELGHAREAEQALDALVARFSQISAYQVGEVHAWRGQPDLAFEWLERAYAQRDMGLGLARIDPLLRKLHGDARWKPFLVKMGVAAD